MTVSIDPLSTSTLKLQMQFYDDTCMDKPTNLGIGTGFFWKSNNQIFLITNLHNVSGKHFETGELLDSQSAAIPNQVLGEFFYIGKNGNVISESFTIPLNKDNKSVWVEHPSKTDVVAINLGQDEILNSVTCVNEINSDMSIRISQEIFVLGYPKGISVNGFPIWKRASIASEPEVNAYMDKPTFLIDTATKEGMSGSPVFAISKGPYQNTNGSTVIRSGIAQSFVGVYSGRLGKNELEAQLGIVWRKEVIEEIFTNVENLVS